MRRGSRDVTEIFWLHTEVLCLHHFVLSFGEKNINYYHFTI